MSERAGMFTSSSLQTFIAASFILALFAMGMGVYNFTRTTQAVSAILDLQIDAMNAMPAADDGQDAAIADLEAKIAALEARLSALEATPDGATDAATSGE